MTESELPLAVIMECRVLANRWVASQWEAVGVLADPGGSDARQLLQDDTHEQWLFPGHVLRLYRDEAENYLLNVTAPQPRVFVMWRLEEGAAHPRPALLTASYGEAARWMDSGEQVDGVPMAPDLRDWVEAYARVHYAPPERKPKRYASSKGGGRAP